MANNIFDNFPEFRMTRKPKPSMRRQSGTIEGTVEHGMVHTLSPNATLHHTIIAMCPHPTKEFANQGKQYRVAYVSIPMDWLPYINNEFADTWDITFVGPTGTIQRLPPALADMDTLLGPRIYIGFDWLWCAMDLNLQPQPATLVSKLTKFVSAVRDLIEPKLL